jgi:hypothetical protein
MGEFLLCGWGVVREATEKSFDGNRAEAVAWELVTEGRAPLDRRASEACGR